ncbi:MAG: SRPBCC family protein [Pseudomonadota bacterium]|nr:SRPBCC family protein [Pseudomonadota bacterium]
MNQDYVCITAPDAVRIERLLPGPIERVWAYLTEPAKRATWFAGGATDLRVGGAMALDFHNDRLTEGDDPPPPKYEKYGCALTMKSRVTACEPPTLLAYTFGGEGAENSEVRFDLAARGDQVHLVLTHRRLANREAMLSVSGGWHAHLDILVARLEGRNPPKFWRNHTRLEAEYERRIPQA